MPRSVKKRGIGAGLGEVQRKFDRECPERLLSFDATERNWRPEAFEFYTTECAIEWEDGRGWRVLTFALDLSRLS